MDWINVVMTVTGYIWWGALVVAVVVFVVVVACDKLFGREPYPKNKKYEDTEHTFYYDHDYTMPLAVVRTEETRDGVNIYSQNYPPTKKSEVSDNFI